MSSSTRDDDPNKPVTGYPTGYPPAQPTYNNHPYPPAQPHNNYPPPATAYPYTAPPPAAYYNPNPYPGQPYDPRRATFIRRLMVAIIAVLIIFGAVTLIVWLVLRPQIPDVRIQSLSVSSFNVSNQQVTGNWDIEFSVRNPNKKMAVLYERIEAFVFYSSESLAQTNLAPFSQGKRNETTLRARMSSLGTYVDDRAVQKMAEDRSSGGVNFNVRMVAYVRFKTGAWLTRRHFMRVLCANVRVGFSSNSAAGTLSGGSKECQVGV